MTREPVLTIGAVPPELGGRTTGGVATWHLAIRAGLLAPGAPAPLAGTIGTNLPPEGPGAVVPPVSTSHVAEQLRALGEETGAGAAIVFGLGHRYCAVDWRALGLRAVATIASWHAVTFAAPGQAAAKRGMLERSVRAVDAVISPSRHARDEGVALGLLGDEVDCHVLPIPVDPRWAAWGAVDEPREGLVFVGALGPRKRPDVVVRCAARLGLPVTFVGTGEPEDDLRALAARLGVRARFAGGSREAVAREMRRARALVVPSVSESFGIAYLEAAACGTPAVGFAPTLAEIEQTAGTAIGAGVTPEAGEDEVTAAIERALALTIDRAAVARALAGPFSAPTVAAAYAAIALGHPDPARTPV